MSAPFGPGFPRLVAALHVHQHIVGFRHLGDWVGKLAPAPILKAMDLAIVAGDDVAVTLDHRGHLLALVGMDEKNDLVMSHDVLLLLG